MEVWGGQSYVTKTRDLEYQQVFALPGNRHAPDIDGIRCGRPFAIDLHYAEPLVQVATDVDSLVAGNTAVALEKLIALELLVRQCLTVAVQVSIEARSRRKQRTLEVRNSILDVPGLHSAVDAVKGCPVPRIFCELRHDRRPA